MFTREIVFEPAWDRRHEDPSKNYGIHGVTIRFHLKGPKGVIQFVLFTGWYLPECRVENTPPFPADLGYHSPVPLRDWQEQPITESCDLLDGRPCYYDGSGLQADRIYDVLLREGSEGVWRELEIHYHAIFIALPEREPDEQPPSE